MRAATFVVCLKAVCDFNHRLLLRGRQFVQKRRGFGRRQTYAKFDGAGYKAADQTSQGLRDRTAACPPGNVRGQRGRRASHGLCGGVFPHRPQHAAGNRVGYLRSEFFCGDREACATSKPAAQRLERKIGIGLRPVHTGQVQQLVGRFLRGHCFGQAGYPREGVVGVERQFCASHCQNAWGRAASSAARPNHRARRAAQERACGHRRRATSKRPRVSRWPAVAFISRCDFRLVVTAVFWVELGLAGLERRGRFPNVRRKPRRRGRFPNVRRKPRRRGDAVRRRVACRVWCYGHITGSKYRVFF